MPSCSNCNQHKKQSEVSATLSGTVICSSCLNAHTALQTPRLLKLKELLALANREQRQQGFFNTLFGNNEPARRAQLIQTDIYNEKLTLVLGNTLAETVTSYPPDWELRRDIVITAHNGKCAKCSARLDNSLHIHHIHHLSRGGTNKLDNLEPLCRDCHSNEHGGKKLNTEYGDSETALSKRIKSINEAILQGKKISFGYKKGGERKYTRRRIQPTSLVTEKRRDGSSSVCVVGYCFTRNAERQFALNKMERLAVLKT